MCENYTCCNSTDLLNELDHYCKKIHLKIPNDCKFHLSNDIQQFLNNQQICYLSKIKWTVNEYSISLFDGRQLNISESNAIKLLDALIYKKDCCLT